MRLEEAYTISEVGREKDRSLLQTQGGFVFGDRENCTALLAPEEAANFIALLRFEENIWRGNHYHMNKVEHLVVLSGTIEVVLAHVEDPSMRHQLVLEAGKKITLLPGCVHAIRSCSGQAVVIEYSSNSFDEADIYQAVIA